MGGWRREAPSSPQAPSAAWPDALAELRAAVARRASPLALQPVATSALQRLAASGGAAPAAASVPQPALAADLQALASAFASAPHLPGAVALAAALDDLFSLGGAAALPSAAAAALAVFLRAAVDAAPSDTAAQPPLRALVALVQARGGERAGGWVSDR